MNTLTKLSLLAVALTLASCNEKVSPELQSGNSTTTGSGTPVAVVPPEYYFKITNSADTMLNFKLHKTGPENADVDCEVSNTIGLSNDAYRADPSTYDISCFYEAEELALRFNGPAFKVEASPNTCEYVGYAPYSYYDQMPGDSSGSYTRITCSESLAGMAAPPALLHACGTYRSTQAAAVAFTMSTASESTLCRFKYENKNCDIGEIEISETIYTRLPGVDEIQGNADDTYEVDTAERTIDCGGEILACIEGPIKNEGELSEMSRGVIVEQGKLNTAYSKNRTFEKLMGKYRGNRKYVNFRRDLASLNIEYGNSDKPLTFAYMSAWGDPTYGSQFDPELMLYYSLGYRMDGTALIPSIPTLENSRYNALPYAADPFLGVSGFEINPYYTFYCFDNAYDIKARIKMVIRDWDRVLPSSATSSYLERISDVDLLPPLARQDVPYTTEVSGDSDGWNNFNDVSDWDDLIEMERDDSGVPYDPSITIWRPLPNATYVDGFFNPAWFPNDKVD